MKNQSNNKGKAIIRQGHGYNCEEYGVSRGPQPFDDVLTFEVIELDNQHILEESCKLLRLDKIHGKNYCEIEGGELDDPTPMLDVIIDRIRSKYGNNSKVLWLASKEDVKRYCRHRDVPIKYDVPKNSKVLSDLGSDGSLILFPKK